MGLSLQDQLLKAGIADKKQAKKAKHEKRAKRKKNNRKKATPEMNQVQQDQLAQAKRSQELNRGELAIVSFDDLFEIIPDKAAQQIADRDQDSLIVLQKIENSE